MPIPLIVAFVLFALSSCALPAAPGSNQSFIAENEIIAVHLVREAGSLMEQARGLDAEIKLWRAYSIAPHATNILSYIVRAREVSNRLDLALPLLDKLLQETPDNINLRAQRARILFKLGFCQESRTTFLDLLSHAVTKEDNDLRQLMLRDLANLEFGCGDTHKALCYLEQAFYLKPTKVDLEQLVIVLISYGYLDRIESLVADTTKQLGPASAALNLHRAYAELALGNQQHALQLFENARTGELESSNRMKLELLELLLRQGLASSDKTAALNDTQVDRFKDLMTIVSSTPNLAIQYPFGIFEGAQKALEANGIE